MTIQEFNLLPDIEKEETILDNGIFISTHNFADKMFDTYQLDSFYVQFYYSVKGNDTAGIICFSDTNNMLSVSNLRNFFYN